MGVDGVEPEKITQLCNDYAKFLKLDISKDVSSTAEVIEETLTRLEEFLSVMVMVQGEHGEKQVENLLKHKQELTAMGDVIDRLEALVAAVTQSVNEVETRLIEAETDVNTNKGTILNLFKPFFRKSEATTSMQPYNPQMPPFEPPEIFKTSDFFPQQDQSENGT